MFWYLQRDFLSLIRKFSGGKIKQKGFFHSAMSMFLLQLASLCYRCIFLASLLLPVSLLQSSLLLQAHSSCNRRPADAGNPAIAGALRNHCCLLSFHDVILHCFLSLEQFCFEVISLFTFPEFLMNSIGGQPFSSATFLQSNPFYSLIYFPPILSPLLFRNLENSK